MRAAAALTAGSTPRAFRQAAAPAAGRLLAGEEAQPTGEPASGQRVTTSDLGRRSARRRADAAPAELLSYTRLGADPIRRFIRGVSAGGCQGWCGICRGHGTMA